MSASDTIEVMPLKKRTQWYWVCQRKACQHEWPAKDINVEPKRCAKCKRMDWNRETKAVGRPRKPAGRTRDTKKKGVKRG